MQLVMPIPKMVRDQDVGAKARAARNRLIKKTGLLVLVVVISSLFCVWSRVRTVQFGYELTKLQSTADDLSKKVNHLSVEVERLKSPAYLKKIATDVLKMRPPRTEDIVFVKKAE